MTTDAAGHYEIRGLASGEYRVGVPRRVVVVESRHRDLLDEFWNDKATLAESDPVMVTAPDATESIDAVLTPGGHIEGTVTDSGSAALEDVYVYAYRSDGSGGWDYVGDSSTDATGHLRHRDAAHGRRTGVQFEPPWRSEYVGRVLGRQGDAGRRRRRRRHRRGDHGRHRRRPGSRLSGDRAPSRSPSGDPAAGVRVTAYREDPDEGWFGWSDATTDAAGAYVIKGLSAGDYKVGFRPPTAEYAFEYYDDKATLAGGDLVTVPAESVVENIDAQLGLVAASRVS